jgi:hypothetical protein
LQNRCIVLSSLLSRFSYTIVIQIVCLCCMNTAHYDGIRELNCIHLNQTTRRSGARSSNLASHPVYPSAHPRRLLLRGGDNTSDALICEGWGEDAASPASRTPRTSHDESLPQLSTAATRESDHAAGGASTSSNAMDFGDGPVIGHGAAAAIAELAIPRMFHSADPAAGDILVPDAMPLPHAARAAGASQRILLRHRAPHALDRILRIRPRRPPPAGVGAARARADPDVHVGASAGPPRAVHIAGEGPAAGGGGAATPTVVGRVVLLEGCVKKLRKKLDMLRVSCQKNLPGHPLSAAGAQRAAGRTLARIYYH